MGTGENALALSGADGDARLALAAYLEPPFAWPDTLQNFPLQDEPFAAWWAARCTGAEPVWAALQERLPQLRFAVAEGISQTDAYRAATRRGDMTGAPSPEDGVQLEQPEALRVVMHPTAAGSVPVIAPACRRDFETLLQALMYRGEPVPIPASMGASMIAGFNNWDRIAELKRTFLEQGNDETAWSGVFRSVVIPDKSLYQDKFILLSDGPYSDLAAADTGLSPDQWRNLSWTIRLEHESTHYFTRRVCGSMRNNLYDELIADYAGLTAAFGTFSSELFLRMLGIGDRAGPIAPHGRIHVYLGTPPLAKDAIAGLRRIVERAADVLERIHLEHIDPFVSEAPEGAARVAAKGEILLALTGLSFDDFAAEDPDARFLAAWTAANERTKGSG